MPRKFLFTREEVIAAAVDLTREQGFAALTARALGARLGVSSKPVFGLFQNMEEVQREVLRAAYELYQQYLAEDMAGDRYPPYKASGMSYIRFAREQRELFKLLFMRDRSREEVPRDFEGIEPVLEALRSGSGLGEDEAKLFHLEMWLYVHGIAVMIVTSYSDWDEALVSRVLTDGYQGLLSRYRGKENAHGRDSD